MSDLGGRVYEFGDVRVDGARFRVTRLGTPLDLEPKAIEVLLFLVERRDRLVLKEEILDGVWRDTFVTPNALTRVVAQLRKALGDDAQEARIIETVPRKGYRFLPDVVVPATGESASLPLPESSVPPRAQLAQAAKPTTTVRTPTGPSFVRLALPLFVGAFVALTAWILVRSSPAELPTLTGFSQLTTTGSEANAAISPDGRRLAYTSDTSGRTEIYVRSLAEGTPIKVASEAGANAGVAWSPDGDSLAYRSDVRGGLWIVGALGGVPRQVVAFGSDPAWSPDGKTLAFSTFEGAFAERGEIMTVPIAGGSPQAVTRPGAPRGGHRHPAFSMDGQRIAFSVFDGTNGTSVWAAPTPGGEPTKIEGDVFPTEVAFTPDDRAVCWSGMGPRSAVGLWCKRLDQEPASPAFPLLQGVSGTAGLSFSRNGTLAYSVRTADSDLWSVALTPAGRAAGEATELMRDTSRTSYPAIAADGEHIAYVAWRPGVRSIVWLLNTKDGRTSELWSGTDSEYFPTWLPDSRHLVIATGQGASRRLKQISIDTRQAVELSGMPSELSNIAVSPDGRSLAYHVTGEKGGLSSWIVSMDGGQPLRLSPADRSAGYPAWSPDGRRLVLEIEEAGKTQLWVIDRDGSNMRQLTSGNGQHWPHSWAPDNDRIAFAGQFGGVWNVWTVSAATGKTEQLTQFTTQNGYVRYPAWSPQNDRIVFERLTETSKIWTGRLTNVAGGQ